MGPMCNSLPIPLCTLVPYFKSTRPSKIPRRRTTRALALLSTTNCPYPQPKGPVEGPIDRCSGTRGRSLLACSTVVSQKRRFTCAMMRGHTVGRRWLSSTQWTTGRSRSHRSMVHSRKLQRPSQLAPDTIQWVLSRLRSRLELLNIASE